ncbi:hypothetical protein [Neobacillus dielmonensis]|uniref:hypothetical protein n=1 Tax=Neobacillus dielmonensis TaxID=1347369 RepID=UPI000694F233|nr:hypothetical protein [Neobacillus dielmonensis]
MFRIRKRPLKKKAKVQKELELALSQDIPLSKTLEKNRQFLSSLYQGSSDVIFRSFVVGKKMLS